jgi:hypothetical protein
MAFLQHVPPAAACSPIFWNPMWPKRNVRGISLPTPARSRPELTSISSPSPAATTPGDDVLLAMLDLHGCDREDRMDELVQDRIHRHRA